MPTTDELQTQIDQLNVRMGKLATSAQIELLIDMLNGYKADTNQLINTLGGRFTTIEAKVKDHEDRLNILEA